MTTPKMPKPISMNNRMNHIFRNAIDKPTKINIKTTKNASNNIGRLIFFMLTTPSLSP